MNRSIAIPNVSRGPVFTCSEAELAEKIEALGGAKICTMASVSPNGTPECAVVGFAISPEGKLILHTHKFSRKWANLTLNPSLALTISSGVYAPYLQIEGVAELFDAGERHELVERTYVTEHPKALAMARTFTSGTILVSPKWARYFEWPRKSGHCTEWLVGQSSVSKTRGNVIMRVAYEDEGERVNQFIRRTSRDTREMHAGLSLIAEQRGRIVGVLCLDQIEPVGLAITCVHSRAKRNAQEILVELVKLAKQIIHSFPCIALVRSVNRSLFERSGFRRRKANVHAQVASLLFPRGLPDDLVVMEFKQRSEAT